MHTQYSPLLSPLSPRCRGSCSYNSQWFWRCSGGGGGDISPLQFPNSEERPSAVTAESGAAAAAAAALSQTDPIKRLPSEKNGNRVISERTTPSASVSDNITCEQSMLSPHRFTHRILSGFTTQGAAIPKYDVRTFLLLNTCTVPKKRCCEGCLNARRARPMVHLNEIQLKNGNCHSLQFLRPQCHTSTRLTSHLTRICAS